MDVGKDEGTSGGSGRLTARRWELSHAERWVTLRRSQDSLSAQLATDFEVAVARLFVRCVHDEVSARHVVAELGPTLSSCDDLTFGHFSQALAYLVWHEVDRYHRVLQAMDLLFECGALPIARPGRQVGVLEVGAGPAPASYASGDYYAALGAWTQAHPGSFASSSSVRAHTLDRGQAWTSLVHRLTEQLVIVSGANGTLPHRPPSGWFFGVTYEDLEGFHPLRLHSHARDTTRRALEDSRSAAEDDSFWPLGSMADDLFDEVEIERAAIRDAPPSAYDLIILANFVTNDEMLQALESDLRTLARSLVPGGVLLTLSACGEKYQRLWHGFALMAEDCLLDHEIDVVLKAHRDPAIHARVAGATIDAFRHLEALAPGALSTASFAPTVKAEVLAALERSGDDRIGAIAAFSPYPAFQVHAFKRGHRAISRRSGRRITRRRGG